MLGSAKTLKRNSKECKEILIGPSMAPRFFRPPRFRHCVFHSLSKSRSRLRAQISRRGWQADLTSRVCQTRTPGPAGASFERNFFDFAETFRALGLKIPRLSGTMLKLEDIHPDGCSRLDFPSINCGSRCQLDMASVSASVVFRLATKGFAGRIWLREYRTPARNNY